MHFVNHRPGPGITMPPWFKLYFICIIYDKYTKYNTTTIQMGFRRKSNDLFDSVSQCLLKVKEDLRMPKIKLIKIKIVSFFL